MYLYSAFYPNLYSLQKIQQLLLQFPAFPKTSLLFPSKHNVDLRTVSYHSGIIMFISLLLNMLPNKIVLSL